MIVYDVSSIPIGMTVDAWLTFLEKKILLYQSGEGCAPFIVDKEDGSGNVSLIDVTNMSKEDIDVIIRFVEEKDKKQKEDEAKYSEVVRKNNEKLIEYLKKL